MMLSGRPVGRHTGPGEGERRRDAARSARLDVPTGQRRLQPVRVADAEEDREEELHDGLHEGDTEERVREEGGRDAGRATLCCLPELPPGVVGGRTGDLPRSTSTGGSGVTSRGGTGLSPAGWEDGAVENAGAGTPTAAGSPRTSRWAGGTNDDEEVRRTNEGRRAGGIRSR